VKEHRREMSSDKEAGASKAAEEPKANVFKNDGSFLELFKKMQEEASKGKAAPEKKDEPVASASSPKAEQEVLPPKPPVAVVGKRRGGRVLPTGQVKKPKSDAPETSDSSAAPKDAWSAYMAEVKKYQSTTCEEEGKNRPLVK
jgi:hypothetical protein